VRHVKKIKSYQTGFGRRVMSCQFPSLGIYSGSVAGSPKFCRKKCGTLLHIDGYSLELVSGESLTHAVKLKIAERPLARELRMGR
jgi:hypothetical protein